MNVMFARIFVDIFKANKGSTKIFMNLLTESDQ